MRIGVTMLSGAVLTAALLVMSGQPSLARGPGGAGPGSFGGEIRGAYQVQGKVICLGCTVQEAKKTSPQHIPDLYTLRRGKQQAVFQITQVMNTASGRNSLLSRWEAITGLTNRLSLRVTEDLWRQLTSTENRQRPVQLTGLLQNTGTFDVSEVTFLE